jgi:catechol 2,3-dioxygenase-like lactoylglutathione lyase family enzyme
VNAARRTLHATLPVSDLGRAREFYEGRLGFETFDENEEGVYYRGAEGTFLALYLSSFVGANPGTGVAFLVPDVEAEVEELRAKGVVFEEYDLPETQDREWDRDIPFLSRGVVQRSRRQHPWGLPEARSESFG